MRCCLCITIVEGSLGDEASRILDLLRRTPSDQCIYIHTTSLYFVIVTRHRRSAPEARGMRVANPRHVLSRTQRSMKYDVASGRQPRTSCHVAYKTTITWLATAERTDATIQNSTVDTEQ